MNKKLHKNVDYSDLLKKLINDVDFIATLNGLRYRVYEFKSDDMFFSIMLN